MIIGEILYHTVQDKGNKEYVIENAPFLCSRKDAWLGEGYYFWECSVDNARWWGEKAYNNKYYICQSNYIEDQNTILDLHGNMSHLRDFKEGYEMLRNEYGKSDFTLPEVIEYMKRKLGEDFDYKAIRISSSKKKVTKSLLEHKYIPASQRKCDFILLEPRIQMCVFDKRSIHTPVIVLDS